MNGSKQVEDFLNFLREAQQEYNIALSREKDANDETQDILHTIELYENKYHDCARLSIALRKVRQERREAKDTEQRLKPIVDWAIENMKIVRSLEQLLGEVRKVEKSTENRYYTQKTDIVERILGGKRD